MVRSGPQIVWTVVSCTRVCRAGSALNVSSQYLTPLPSAISLTVFNRWPIIVADIDRLSRLSLDRTGPSGVQIVSARNGLGADYVVVKAEAVRAQKEGERISELTRAALQVRKSRTARARANPPA